MSDLRACAGDAAAAERVLSLAVDGCLRFELSNQLGNRRALAPATVGGVDLPAGALVTLCIVAANRARPCARTPKR